MTHHELQTDFVVVGGGLAGVCAALAAARNGAKVVLIQDRSVLGGNASSEIRMHTVGADIHGRRPGARETGIIEELRLEDAARNPHRSYAQWDLLLYEKVMGEPNITLLLDTDCTGCVKEKSGSGQKRIVSLNAVRQLTEERFTIRGSFFADCSGDGRLGFEAGAEFTVGREGKSDYGESLALDNSDRQTLGSSIMFTARKYDAPQPFRAPSWVRRFEKREFTFRPIDGFEYGYWWAEWGGQLDTIKDNAVIRHELLRIALGVWDYVKNSGHHPDSANWALDWVGAIPGKRESRRFLGPHVLTQQDLQAGIIFPDTVAYGGWPLDLHPPSGIDATEEAPCRHFHLEHLYGIPLRSLYSRNVANLFFAGRNISATHVAFASTRVMATCAVMGQAIGTAAARAVGARAEEIGAFFSEAEMANLQQRLLRDDAFLPGLRNADENDLARTASVAASSEVIHGAAAQVIDGASREWRPDLGPWADGSTHRWTAASLPAWIELSWPAVRTVREIHLTFDSGLQRELTLSASDSTTKKIVRAPQPELVRDYTLLLDGRPVLEVKDNLLRKRVHRLPAPVAASRLRLQVQTTHGVAEARVFEIRVY
ncbi:FAD dependent oxidoreductase family protein [Nibricoccus aquaticus]|uniref:FAD dependent oxidoreductase family protein n=1 Tax=Nibricoccus aquaticus TaxID=2576891 RepID=A0A290QLZ2_9BACT|nr:FAD-dependent oxidoreductase [Nibricoccus aquaticus]ATC65551.1 FAD dependent oxidoreductase family protein [Nibricoccus aquaticus]